MQGQLQDYSFLTIRSAAVLTNAYVAATSLSSSTSNYPLKVELRNQLELYIALTLGNLASAQVKLEFSNDGSTWYQEAFSSISGATDTVSLGEHSFATSGNYRLATPIKDAWIRVSAKGTGDVTNSSMSIGSVVGVA